MAALKTVLYLLNQFKGYIMTIKKPLSAGERVKFTAAIVPPRRLSAIARDIRRAWPRVYFAAAPYLEAMQYLDNINDTYMYDDARSVVRYFLANAAQFRGDSAKALKAELKALL